MEILLILALGALYFLPGIVATARHHDSAAGLWTLNVLLGWTLLGWVGALVWAISGKARNPANARGAFEVVGTSFNNEDGSSRAEAIAHLAPGRRVQLLLEPNNAHDPNAVAVIAGARCVGYLPAGMNQLINAVRAGTVQHAIVTLARQSSQEPPLLHVRPLYAHKGLNRALFGSSAPPGTQKLIAGGIALFAITLLTVLLASGNGRSTDTRPSAPPRENRPAITTPQVNAPRWQVRRGTSDISDMPWITISSGPERVARDRFGRELDTRLTLRCMEDTSALLLEVDDYTGTRALPVTLRIDNGGAFVVQMQPSTARDTIGLWVGRESIPIIRQLDGAGILTVRYTLPSENATTLRFNLGGLPPRIGDLRATCNW